MLIKDIKCTVFLFVGECKSIPDCEEGELEDFPRRMREWLFNVMEELADRGQLTPHFSKLHKEVEVQLMITFDIQLCRMNMAPLVNKHY